MIRQHNKSSCQYKSSLRFILRRFIRNRKGATAVEFSFIALPFLTLLFAIIEVSLIFFGTLALDNAVEEVGRLVRTGQAQASSMSVSAFKDKICSQVITIFDCKDKIQVELVTFDSFQSAGNHISDSSNSALNKSGELRDNFAFEQNSNAEDIILLRVFYEWDLTLAFPGVGLANMDNGNRLISATTAFRNEPFQ